MITALKAPSPKWCTEITKIWTHKLSLEKNPMVLCTSVLPRFYFSKCIRGLQMCLHLRPKCHLVIDGTLSKYLKLCLATWYHSYHQLLFLQCFILPYFFCVTFITASKQNKRIKAGQCIMVKYFFLRESRPFQTPLRQNPDWIWCSQIKCMLIEKDNYCWLPNANKNFRHWFLSAH